MKAASGSGACVLLLKAPREQYSYFREGSESLALAYLGASLRQAGHRADILDAQLENLTADGVLERLAGRGTYSLVGLTVADPSFIAGTYRLAEALREHWPSAHFTIGGYAPTFHYRDVLQQCEHLDSVVLYEGEQTLLELVEAVYSEADWRSVPGIAFRRHNQVLTTGPRPLLHDLDALPFPARDYVPFIKEHLPGIGVVSVAGSRGCYANCGFCCIRQFYGDPGGPAYRLRSVGNLVDEIEQLVEEHGIDEVLPIDDIFTLPGHRGDERVDQLAAELRTRDLKVMLSISDRVDHIVRPRYDRLHQAGVRQIMVGIESTNDEILRFFNKRISLPETRRALQVLAELEIDATVTYINFTPLTTLEILRENLATLLDLKVNFLLGLLNRLQVYVGTPVADWLVERDLVRGEFPDFSYTIPDHRVETVYDITRACLSPFLEISYAIMKLERIFRVKRFRLEAAGKESGLVREGRQWFARSCRRIMEEAAEIFGWILDLVEEGRQPDDETLAAVRQRTEDRHELWHRELVFIRDYSPFFDTSDLYPLAGERR